MIHEHLKTNKKKRNRNPISSRLRMLSRAWTGQIICCVQYISLKSWSEKIIILVNIIQKKWISEFDSKCDHVYNMTMKQLGNVWEAQKTPVWMTSKAKSFNNKRSQAERQTYYQYKRSFANGCIMLFCRSDLQFTSSPFFYFSIRSKPPFFLHLISCHHRIWHCNRLHFQEKHLWLKTSTDRPSRKIDAAKQGVLMFLNKVRRHLVHLANYLGPPSACSGDQQGCDLSPHLGQTAWTPSHRLSSWWRTGRTCRSVAPGETATVGWGRCLRSRWETKVGL